MDETPEQILRAVRVRASAILGVGTPSQTTVPPPDASRLERLAAADSPLCRAVILTLFAAEYDPLMRLLLRACQGSPDDGLEVGTIAELLQVPLARTAELARLLAGDGPLAEAGFITVAATRAPAMATRARLSPRLARHLLGDDQPAPHVTWTSADAPLEGDAPRELELLLSRLEDAWSGGEPIVVEIAGAPGTRKDALAHHVAAALGCGLATVDARRAQGTELAPHLRDARLEARLRGGLINIANWDAALEQRSAAGDPAGQSLPPPPPRIPDAIEGCLASQRLILLTAETSQGARLQDRALVLRLDVPFPHAAERARIFARCLAEEGVAADLEDVEHVSRRYALDPERLRKSAREVAAAARARGEAAGASQLAAACRAQLRHDFDGLAERVTNHHRVDDLVVPHEIAEALGEMVAFVRHARQVYDDWGFARRHSLSESVTALFAGPPGTGKTMCASVMAHALDLELFRVDLSRVVSKWVGETEKNLGRIFDEAERSGAILLFDEADSLFSKRTGVKSSADRYANLEVNYLLQRLESFRGLSILTTNNEDLIDPAFKRRMTFRLQFVKPDAAARAELWRKAFPDEALLDHLDVDALAQVAELSGASIRNAAVRAAFLAASLDRAIDMELCETAAVREATEMGLLTRAAEAPQRSDEDLPARESRSSVERAPSPRRVRPIHVSHPRRVA
jgi:AAA+ superfamily predicted ATPase